MHVILIYNPFTQKPSNLVLSILWFIGSDYSFVIFKPCIVYPLIYRFWLLLCYLQTLYCLSFDLQVLITPLYSSNLVLSILWFTGSDYSLLSLNLVLSILWFTGSDYSFVIFKPFWYTSVTISYKGCALHIYVYQNHINVFKLRSGQTKDYYKINICYKYWLARNQNVS
jgi:hypothetical protein